MLIRSLALVLIVISTFVLVTGQAPDAQKTGVDKAIKPSHATKKLRDVPLPAGVDLQFLIKELAREVDLNVLFDPDSFRTPRRTSIDVKNVTTAEALEYIFLQEGLYYEVAGPRTILVSSRVRGTSISQIGVGVTPLTPQLAQYFGVGAGILINTVLDNSPASKAGLKAGDVIVEVDGAPVNGALGVVRAINEKSGSDVVVLTIVRDRKRQTTSITPEKGIGSILQSRGNAGPLKPLK